MRSSAFCGVAVTAGFLSFTAKASGQTLGGAQAADVSMVHVILALGFCVALAVAAAYALRFRMTGRLDLPRMSAVGGRRLVLVERLRLGTQHELCLVALEGSEFLISVSPTGIARFDPGGETRLLGKS